MASSSSSSSSSTSSSAAAAAAPPLAKAFLVSPCLPTPHDILPLTHGSAMAGLSSIVSSHALVFHHMHAAHPPLDVITSSLSQVLVPYYPLAGRIVQTSHGWEVLCDGRGAVVVVTSVPPSLPLPQPPPPPPSPIPNIAPALLVQITELADGGGYMVGIRVCNGICDASGLVHFLNGWAEMARGEGRVSVAPLWNAFGAHVPPLHPQYYSAARGAGGNLDLQDEVHSVHVLPPPPRTSQGDTDPSTTVYYIPFLQEQHGGGGSVQQNIHFPSLGVPDGQVVGDQRTSISSEAVRLELPLRSLKATVRRLQEKEGSVYSMSHVLAAHVWRERTRALRIPPTAETRLFFVCDTFIDVEKKPTAGAAAAAPMGFYGPFKFNCVVAARAGDLLEMPLSSAAECVKFAHDNLTHDSIRACFDEFKRLHSSARPMAEVMIFTEMPPSEAVHRQLDFGPSMGRPDRLNEGPLVFPSSVNVAAVAPLDSATVSQSSLQIYFNNVSDAYVDDLRYGICDSLSVYDQAAVNTSSSRL